MEVLWILPSVGAEVVLYSHYSETSVGTCGLCQLITFLKRLPFCRRKKAEESGGVPDSSKARQSCYKVFAWERGLVGLVGIF